MTQRGARLAQDPRSSDAVFGALLFVVALVPRLWVALAWAGEPVWDGHYYDFGARRIAQGFGYSDDVARRRAAASGTRGATTPSATARSSRLLPPLRATGRRRRRSPTRWSGRLLAVVTWALARHALVRRAGARRRGSIVALHPGLILYAALVMTEPLAALAHAARRSGSPCATPRPMRGARARRAGARRRGARAPAGAALRAVPRAGLPATAVAPG